MLGKLIPEGLHSSHQPFDDPNTRNLVKEVSLKVGWKNRVGREETTWAKQIGGGKQQQRIYCITFRIGEGFI